MRIPCLLLALLALTSSASANWNLEAIAPAAVRSSLAVDDVGTVHVSYDTPSHEVWYGVRSEAAWVVEVLATDVSWPALRLTSEGRPWVVFGRDGPGNENLFLARKNTEVWALEDTEIFGHFASIAIDGDGNPHLAYNVDPLLWYARKDTSVWQVIGPDVVNWLAYLERTPIEVDSEGTVYIGYVNQLPQRNVRLATRIGAVWSEQLIADGENVSLALDAGDQLHICLSNDLGQLEYRVSATSTAEIVDRDRTVGETALVVAVDGAIHIAYESSEGLRYARRTTAGWSSEPVAPSGVLPSIDIGPASVHVTYVDNGVLQHAWRSRVVATSQMSSSRMKSRFGSHR